MAERTELAAVAEVVTARGLGLAPEREPEPELARAPARQRVTAEQLTRASRPRQVRNQCLHKPRERPASRRPW
jgi:hypothetical protein